MDLVSYLEFEQLIYFLFQSVLCSCVELCLESISSLSNIIKSMPTEFDLSCSPLPEEMLYPVVRCKDKSVGEGALKLLEVFFTVVILPNIEKKFQSVLNFVHV